MADLRLRNLGTLRAAIWVWLPMGLTTLLHYGTSVHAHSVHDVARRLFYLPIIVGGTLGGLRGGLAVSLFTIAVYAPHAWLPQYVGHDPGTGTEKALEMVFYVVLGVLSGGIAERQHAEQRRKQELVDQLQDSLQQVRAKDEQLLRAARLQALGELTAGLAHEIRNPLHAMRGTAEILLDAVPPAGAERELGEAHIQEIDRLASVLDRFLDFARHRDAERESLPLDEVVAHVAHLIRAQAARQGTSVDVLPGPALQAWANRDQLVQVVLGICLNALQSLDSKGRVTLTLVGTESTPDRLRGIRIANDGPPIDPELLERIFDPFVSTRDMGTGLGLSTAWRIVEAHFGKIDAENLPDDAGVAFTVWLPETDPGPTT